MQHGKLALVLALVGTAVVLLYLEFAYRSHFPGNGSVQQSSARESKAEEPKMSGVDVSWYPPSASWITDLAQVVNGSGVHGSIFNSSELPAGVSYGTYNWCNMPHLRREEYVVPSPDYALEYVELIHRHHKRTPYLANTFPKEGYSWDCSDEGLFYYGQPLNPSGNRSASTYWQVYVSASNPFAPAGFNGTCQFPQITRQGLEDSFQHGKDLWGVYHDLLRFLPSKKDDTVSYRVTNNVITSQVGGMVASAMYPDSQGNVRLQIQPSSIDSLEPTYPCPNAANLFGNYSAGSNSSAWVRHLNATSPLFAALDAVSNVPRSDKAWHASYDHYYDNLSARQCHAKPLPCNITDPGLCVTQRHADEVYRLGQYEYSYAYRGAAQSLPYAVASYGVWLAELVQNIRDVAAGLGRVRYRHNVAHDGSVARVLAILQVEQMVWPGMGSEIVFEVWRKESGARRYLRVLWGGRVLRSSHPILGTMDLLDLEVFTAYIDALVGRGASKIPGLCKL